MNPIVSIISPVYGRGDLVVEAVKSVSYQTVKNWELLLVDDGSDDGTFEILEMLADSDPRIRVYRRPEELAKGAPSCRNFGLDEARGDHLLFLDSDDLLEPTCLEQRLDAMAKEPTLAFLARVGQIFPKGEERPRFVWNRPSDDSDLDRFLWGEPAWQTTGPLWRTQKLRDSGVRWDEQLTISQDLDFHIACLVAGLRGIYQDNVDHRIRCSRNEGTSITSNWESPRSFRAMETIQRKWFHRFGQDASPAGAVRKNELTVFLVRLSIWLARKLPDDEEFAPIQTDLKTLAAAETDLGNRTIEALFPADKNGWLSSDLHLSRRIPGILTKISRCSPIRRVPHPDIQPMEEFQFGLGQAFQRGGLYSQASVQATAMGETAFHLARRRPLRAMRCLESRSRRAILNLGTKKK